MNWSFLIMLLVPLIWSINFIFGKMLISMLPPFTIGAIRFTIAGLLFLVWIWIKKKKLPRGDWHLYLNLLIVSLTGIVAFNSILYIGLRYTSVVNGTIINSFNPIPTFILAIVILKEKISWPKITGALLSIMGVFLIMSSGNLTMINKFSTGDIIILLNTFIWALFSVMGKKVMNLLSPLETIAFTTLMGLPFLWLASFIEIHVYQVQSLSWSAVAMLVFLGIFASFLAFVWWYKGIQDFGASGAAIFYNLIPLYALIISRFLLGEPIYSFQIFGGLLIIGGVVLSSLVRGSGH
jgi:drug/metabolite transporter (DMT)-like permease